MMMWHNKIIERIAIDDKRDDANSMKPMDKKRCLADSIVGIQLKILTLLSILMVITLLNINEVNGLTQFYIALPDVVKDLNGVTLSVEISDYKNFPTVSWTHNGSMLVPDNRTIATEPNYDHLHLDNNDFLLAINDTVPPGTRLYICAEIPYPNTQYDCQWDAVDRNSTGFAEFDFYFQSHKDLKR